MINKTLRFILGLTFLPERARRWIFGTGTRVVEILNLSLLVSLAIAFWLDSGDMMRLSNYRGFALLFGDSAHNWMTCLFGLLAVLAAAGIASTSERPRRLGKELVKAATTSEEINGHRDDALSALAQL